MKRFIKAAVSFIILVILIALLAVPSGGRRGIIEPQDVYSEDFVLGVVPFSAAQPQAEASGAELRYFDDFFAACGALDAGKLDGFADDSLLIRHYADANPGLTPLALDFGSTEFCGVMRKSDASLVKEVNDFISAFAGGENSAAQQLRSKWMYGDDPKLPDIEPPSSPKGTLRIITSATAEPYSYIGDDGQLTGLEPELGIRIASALGMNWEFVVADQGALLNSLASGKGDIILSCVNTTDEASDDIVFTDPYYSARVGVLIQSSRSPGSEDDTGTGLRQRIKSNLISTFLVQDRWKVLLKGVGVTLLISVCSFVLANVVGDRLCAAKRSDSRLRRRMSEIFTRFMDGVPAIALLMLLYYVIFRNVDLSAFTVAVIGFAVTCGAELESVFELGINSVGKGQLEAAESIGFTRSQIFRLIIFPQAASRVFGLYKNTFVSLIKSTSVVGYIAIMDVTKVTDLIRSRTYAPFFPLICSTVLYFLLTQLVLFVLKRIGLRFDMQHKSRLIKGVKTG